MSAQPNNTTNENITLLTTDEQAIISALRAASPASRTAVQDYLTLLNTPASDKSERPLNDAEKAHIDSDKFNLKPFVAMIANLAPVTMFRLIDMVEVAMTVRDSSRDKVRVAEALIEFLEGHSYQTRDDLPLLYQHDEEWDESRGSKGLVKLAWAMYGNMIQRGMLPIPNMSQHRYRHKAEIANYIQSQIDKLFLCLDATGIEDNEIS